jgi:hypothetical protein
LSTLFATALLLDRRTLRWCCGGWASSAHELDVEL